MTPQEIIEGNKLIAEFMGYKLITPNMRKRPEEWTISYWENPDFKGSSRGVLCSEHGLSYNSSWNWLMKVVEKIESLGFYFNIKKNHVVVAYDNKDTRDSKMIHSEWGDQSKIERVFQCAVAFVKYCNQNKPV